MKKILFPVIVLIMCAFFSLTAYAGPGYWVLSNNGRWWYQYYNGTYPANGWALIDNTYYYFDAAGWMLSDTITPDGYRVGPDGAWIPGGGGAGSTASASKKSGTFDFIYSDNYVVTLTGNTIRFTGNYRVFNDDWDTIATGYMDEAFQITENTRFYEDTEYRTVLSLADIREFLSMTNTFIHCRIIVQDGKLIELSEGA